MGTDRIEKALDVPGVSRAEQTDDLGGLKDSSQLTETMAESPPP